MTDQNWEWLRKETEKLLQARIDTEKAMRVIAEEKLLAQRRREEIERELGRR